MDAPKPFADRQRRGKGSRADALRVVESPGHLEQRQRVARGALDEALAHRRRHVVGEESVGLGHGQAAQREHRDPLGQPGRCGLAARRDEEGDGVRAQPAGGEPDRRRGLRVQPLGIVDEHQHRRQLGGGREHGQGRRGNQEGVRRRGGVRPAQCRGQRLRLRRGQPVRQFPQRAQQTDQPAVRQRCLGLGAEGPQTVEAVRPLPRGLEQRRLADTRLALDAQ